MLGKAYKKIKYVFHNTDESEAVSSTGQVLFSANAAWTGHIAVIWDNMKAPFSIEAPE